MAFPLIQPVTSSLISAITGKGQEDGFLPLLGFSFNDERSRNRSQKGWKRIKTWMRILNSNSDLKQYQHY